jgi:hypothetical protein
MLNALIWQQSVRFSGSGKANSEARKNHQRGCCSPFLRDAARISPVADALPARADPIRLYCNGRRVGVRSNSAMWGEMAHFAKLCQNELS